MKNKLKKTFKRYRQLIVFCVLEAVTFVSFLSLMMEDKETTYSDVCNAFIRNRGLEFCGFMTWCYLLGEITEEKHEVLWRFNRCYWWAGCAILYGILAMFATEWNWSVIIIPIALVIRLAFPLKRLQAYL